MTHALYTLTHYAVEREGGRGREGRKGGRREGEHAARNRPVIIVSLPPCIQRSLVWPVG